MEIRGSRILHHRIQNHLQVVTDTAFLLDCELVIRTDNHLKIFIPKLHHRASAMSGISAGRSFRYPALNRAITWPRSLPACALISPSLCMRSS